MTTAVSPATLRMGMPVSVTVTATNRSAGTGQRRRRRGEGHHRDPFTFTFPANRRLVDGEWEWVPVVPAASVEAPGYDPGAVVFDVIS